MDYNNRKYYFQLEEEYGIKFPMLKTELKGKGQDGITAAQKRKLWAQGVNVTGIHYKGSACAIISFVETLRETKPQSKDTKKDTNLWQVKYRLNDSEWRFSKMLFDNETEAEYQTAKHVPPEYDVQIVQYKDLYYQTISGKKFADKNAAIKTGEKYYLFAIR